MKLTGTATEEEYRNDLIGSVKFLSDSLQGGRVRRALSQLYGDVRTAFVLTHTPEQGEDIFRILVNGSDVVGFDLQLDDKDCVATNVSIVPVKKYERMIQGRSSRLRLAIALELSAQSS